LQKLPPFTVSPLYYGRAIAAGLGLVVLPFGSFLALMGIGYLTGEGISLAVNRKRSGLLRVIAGLSVFLGYALSGSILGLLFTGQLVYIPPRMDIYALLGLVVGVFLATNRLK